MIERYGSEEAVREVMRAAQTKSRQNPNSRKGGFHHLKNTNPEELSKRSREAANKRWHNEEN